MTETPVEITCPNCQKTRTVTLDPAMLRFLDSRCTSCADAEDAEAAERERVNQIMARLNRSNLPPTLRGKILEPGPLLDLAHGWAAGEIPILTLHGPVGVGKTYFAAAAFRLALVHRQVHWIEVARLMAQLQGDFGDEDRRAALAAFTGTGPAIFDDLDKVLEARWGLPKLFAALDGRIVQGAPVIITMNSDLDGLVEKITKARSDMGEPIASRLRSGKVVKLTGQDRRRGS